MEAFIEKKKRKEKKLFFLILPKGKISNYRKTFSV